MITCRSSRSQRQRFVVALSLKRPGRSSCSMRTAVRRTYCASRWARGRCRPAAVCAITGGDTNAAVGRDQARDSNAAVENRSPDRASVASGTGVLPSIRISRQRSSAQPGRVFALHACRRQFFGIGIWIGMPASRRNPSRNTSFRPTPQCSGCTRHEVSAAMSRTTVSVFYKLAQIAYGWKNGAHRRH